MKTIPSNERAFRHLIQRYKQLAKFRKMDFSLTNEQCFSIFKGNCQYCGIEPNQIHNGLKGSEPFRYNGIDRKDSLKGYVDGNCVPCCKSCNSRKHVTDADQMIQPGKMYGNYLVIQSTDERLHGQVLWECYHYSSGQIKKVLSGNLRREERIVQERVNKWIKGE